MKRLCSAAAVGLATAAMLSGCSKDLASAVMPGVHLDDLHPIYVVCSPQEDADICELLATDLAARGLASTRGPAADLPPDAAAVVTYEDRWMWDGLPYLLTLRVELRDPRTNVLLATARAFRTSLARVTPPTMVREVVDSLFTAGKAT